MREKQKKIVILGGGSGTAVVLSGLKNSSHQLSAIVVVSDSGGSTGRLRDEFGFLPVGDLRQCLAALASGDDQEKIRQVLLYRFPKGQGLRGHNLGNLILTALEDIEQSPGKAIETAAKIFRTKGSVFPITEQSVDLVVEYQDGTIKLGEDHLDDLQSDGQKIKKIKLSPRASIYPHAKKAIQSANMIVIGPGDLYGSLLPNTLVRGFKSALKKSGAKFVYVVNLMTHFSQTNKMTAQDHLSEIKRYCGRSPDVVIVNSGAISTLTLNHYRNQKEYPVVDDLPRSTDYTIVRDNFISTIAVKQHPNDTVVRSVLRHNQKKLAQTLLQLL